MWGELVSGVCSLPIRLLETSSAVGGATRSEVSGTVCLAALVCACSGNKFLEHDRGRCVGCRRLGLTAALCVCVRFVCASVCVCVCVFALHENLISHVTPSVFMSQRLSLS